MRFRVLIVLLIVIFGLNRFKSQVNLVPNPSFETFSVCPNSAGQISNAIGWNNFSGTCDYFNSCDMNSGFSVPFNSLGYQIPSFGNAYGGCVTYMSPSLIYLNYREHMGIALVNTLTIGVKYYVSFKTVLTKSNLGPSNCATSKIGAMFSTITFSNSISPITNNPKIYSNSLITDTTNWTSVFGSFIADSAYKYIALGNFFSNNNTDTLIFTNDSYCSSYYFIDDVCVSTDSTFCSEYSTSVREFNKTNELQLFPNPANSALQINGIEEGAVLITTIFGEVIERLNKFENKSTIINTSNYPDGLYFVKTKNTMLKLVIKH